ncbi:MAG: putative lipid II flippase FtsW [Deltaproteobacteria bacterium]|nr:putative lipid II flippase FtsW [Deltaproteobacteria bacterium]
MNKREKNSKGLRYDPFIIIPLLLLIAIGVLMIYSASSATAAAKRADAMFFLKKQTAFALFGIAGFLICSNISYNFFKKIAYLGLFGSALLLSLIYFGFGITEGGATRWLKIGALHFQPSEAAKIGLIIYMAYSLSKKHENIKKFSIGFFPHIVILAGFLCLILNQPDLGSALILACIVGIMMFVAGVRILHLSSALLLFIPIIYNLIFSATYRAERILSYLDPWKYATDEGYQAVHSLMAFGTGGIFGAGIGNGYQKLFYLPEAHTDFIFSVIGEELGLLGTLFIISLYMIIIFRGIIISKNAKDLFGTLLAVGITTSFGLQVCINIGVAMGLLPTKGLTLPLLSYGGTSLLVSSAALGILANIGKNEKPV